jgi:hypothetical protein
MMDSSYDQVMAHLPAAVRAAIETHDAYAFQCALDDLTDEQAGQVLRQLESAGIIGPGPTSEADFQEILREFDLLIQAIVAVARGDEGQRSQVLAVLPSLDKAGYHLEQPVLLLWAGERQTMNLIKGLDSNSTRLVEHILGLVAGEVQQQDHRDMETLATSIPVEVLAAIKAQDEEAYQRAMARLSPAERKLVSEQLAFLQAQADVEAEAWLAALPVDVRLAVLDQDSQRLKAALQNLPPAQAQEILQQLEAAGLLEEPDEPQADLLMAEFEPLALAAASVVKGNQSARPQLEALLDDLDQEGWHLSTPVQRIWAGERDISALCDGLDGQDQQIIRRILEHLD